MTSAQRLGPSSDPVVGDANVWSILRLGVQGDWLHYKTGQDRTRQCENESMGGILRSTGSSPEVSSRRISGGRILAGRPGAAHIYIYIYIYMYTHVIHKQKEHIYIYIYMHIGGTARGPRRAPEAAALS